MGHEMSILKAGIDFSSTRRLFSSTLDSSRGIDASRRILSAGKFLTLVSGR
jgi:hypothetical protein